MIANMIGTGVFTSTGFQAASAPRSDDDPARVDRRRRDRAVRRGRYAELGSMMPRAGGEYVYLREAYHPAARLHERLGVADRRLLGADRGRGARVLALPRDADPGAPWRAVARTTIRIARLGLDRTSVRSRRSRSC